MNILLLGSGGREHAIAWKISQSNKLSKLFIAPGNAGTSEFGTNVQLNINDFRAIKKFVLENNINMVVVGPEEPLVNGIADFFSEDKQLANIALIGPNKKGAQLEGSKDFSKKFMRKYNIPTAKYQTFTKEELPQAINFLGTMTAPYVLKADGLAAGKGVIISNSLTETIESLKILFDGQFGEASKKVVIEEFLSGLELSVFIVTDGNNYVILPEAKDYKRIGEGDTGLNTGGMGSISPVPFATKEFMDKIEKQIIIPTVEGLKKENINYKGFIFFGLIKVKGEPFVIEYNARMGDPETESVMPRIKSDFVELLEGVANNTLNTKSIEFDERHVSSVMLVSKGYPENYKKGEKINGLTEIKDSIIFHAGTKFENNKVLTNGGRVLAISSYGNSMDEALKISYKNAEAIIFEGKNYRTDLGFDLR